MAMAISMRASKAEASIITIIVLLNNRSGMAYMAAEFSRK